MKRLPREENPGQSFFILRGLVGSDDHYSLT